MADTLIDVGRVCVKTAGREAGKICVVVKKIDSNYVMVTGPRAVTKIKRRKCNVNHLEPLQEKISIKAEATDEEVVKELEKENLFEKLGIEKPSAEAIKRAEERKEQKEAKKEEKKAEKKEEKPEKPKKEARPKKKEQKKEKK